MLLYTRCGCLCQTPMNTALSFVKRMRLKQQRHQFNATSTYARSSDVPTPYFAGICRDADTVDRRMTSISDRLLSKDRAVAWFATHCWTSSKRERYNMAQRQCNKHIYLDARLLCRLVTRCSHVIALYVVLMGMWHRQKAIRMSTKSPCSPCAPSCCIHAFADICTLCRLIGRGRSRTSSFLAVCC